MSRSFWAVQEPMSSTQNLRLLPHVKVRSEGFVTLLQAELMKSSAQQSVSEAQWEI